MYLELNKLDGYRKPDKIELDYIKKNIFKSNMIYELLLIPMIMYCAMIFNLGMHYIYITNNAWAICLLGISIIMIVIIAIRLLIRMRLTKSIIENDILVLKCRIYKCINTYNSYFGFLAFIEDTNGNRSNTGISIGQSIRSHKNHADIQDRLKENFLLVKIHNSYRLYTIDNI